MPAPEKILQLVERFDTHSADYKRSVYNETQTRREFIDPFFQALGWDVDNSQGKPESLKEVIHEAKVTVEDEETAQKMQTAPDYCFLIEKQRKFFVEAKKPSVSLKDNIHPAYQLRCYGWNAKLPISILTDFEEFAVYDCRIQPDKHDKAAHARLWYATYSEYADKWDDFARLFSRDAVAGGSLDQYAETHKDKRGSLPVDVAFLQEIEQWRDQLARHLAARNPGLTRRDLNYAVQRTIDRLIFLRICEGRGIEPYGRLQTLLQRTDIYPLLLTRFREADAKYNSGIFHFKPESGQQDPPDTLTPHLAIDDEALKPILKRLYYPDSPYLFEVIPAEILGQVYEQFLGKVICLDATHQASVEDKPEVKKAGGVYYTPAYIVDYIVKQTVGELFKNKDLPGFKNLGGLNLTILDPACGSGSFLLGAYQYLLDWHREQYIADDPKKWSKSKPPRLRQIGNDWKLTIAERKRILLAHIYGVDIDAQAVEVTKLSLLLKVLEGEDEQSVGQMGMFHERVLPNLANNIKCGNSLIGSDFYEGKQLGLMNEDELYRVNAFDWEQEFPAIMRAGGFDAVIGNPPYIRIQAMKEWVPLEVEFYKRKYIAATKGNYDIYVVFVECGLKLLNKIGKLGYILPSKFLSTDYGTPLRKLLSTQNVLEKIIDFGHEQVFQNATTYTCLLFLDQTKPKELIYINTSPTLLSESSLAQKIPHQEMSAAQWVFVDNKGSLLLKKISQNSTPFIDIFSEMSRGISTGADDIFCLSLNNGQLFAKDGNPIEIEQEILRTPLYASDFTRYFFQPENNEQIIFPYIVSETRCDLIEESILREKYPNAYAYLCHHKKKLEERKQCRIWYGYSAPRSLHIHERAEIIVPLLANKGLYTIPIINSRKFCMMASAGFSIRLKNTTPAINPYYILGIINSQLLFWNLRLLSNKFRGGWITCTKQYFGQLPIKNINFSNSKEKAQHDNMVDLVQQIMGLQAQRATAQNPQAQTMLQRQIAALDGQIDRLVYALYGLTEEDIRIVEGGS